MFIQIYTNIRHYHRPIHSSPFPNNINILHNSMLLIPPLTFSFFLIMLNGIMSLNNQPSRQHGEP